MALTKTLDQLKNELSSLEIERSYLRDMMDEQDNYSFTEDLYQVEKDIFSLRRQIKELISPSRV